MAQGSVKDTTGYVNYVYNISARGTTEVASQLMGLSGMASNVLGQLAFQTSSYLSTTEGALLSMGIVATAGFTKATQQAMEFDQALSTIGAISGKTRDEVSGLGEQAMAMSNKFGIATSEMTQGLESLARAGVSTNNMFNILEQAMGLSKLEGLSLDTAINDLISTTNLLDTQGLDLSSPEYAEAVAYQNQKITATSEAAPINAQDIIHTLEHVGGYASSTNLDQDDLYAVIAQLGSKGTKSEMAGTSLRAFLAAGQKDTAQRALERIGLKVSDLWKNDETIMSISDMKDVLDEAMDAKGYTQQEKIEFYSDFAGYKQANQIMKIDTSSVREFKEKIDHSWDMGQKINQVIGTAETHVQGLFNAGKNLLTKVGEPFLPIISTIAWTLKTGIDIINMIPGSNLVISGGLILASVKAISTIFNKIVPLIVSAKGNLGGISGIFTSIREDLNESYTLLKNIHDVQFMSTKARELEAHHITDKDKQEYWQERLNRRIKSPFEIQSLEIEHNFYNDEPYIEWKKEKAHEPIKKPKKSRNQRESQKNPPSGAGESSNNRKDNKKSDCCDILVSTIKEGFIAQISNTNTIKNKLNDIYGILSNPVTDKSVIDDLKNTTFDVKVINMPKYTPTEQTIPQSSQKPSTQSSQESSTEETIEFNPKLVTSRDTSKPPAKADTILLTDRSLDQTKVDKFIDDFDFDFGFDQSTIEGQEAHKIASSYAKDILRDNFQHNKNQITGQKTEVLKQRLKNETKKINENEGLMSIIASSPDIVAYSDDEIARMLEIGDISYDENLKSKSDILKPLGLDYNRLLNKSKIDPVMYMNALAKLADIEISDINTRSKGGSKFKSKMGNRIASVFEEESEDIEKQNILKDAVSMMDLVFDDRVSYHYVNNLNNDQRKEFMDKIGLEKTDNAYVDMIQYLKKFNSLHKGQKKGTIITEKNKHLDLISEIGNIVNINKDKLNITSVYSPYRRDLTKGPNVKNEINSEIEKAIKMQGTTGYGGIGSHIKKIVETEVELALQQDILAIKKEMEENLGRKVSIREVIKSIDSLAFPHRYKRQINDYDDIGKNSPDVVGLEGTIYQATQQMHDDSIGSNEKYKTATKGSPFYSLQNHKLVFTDKKDEDEIANTVFFEKERNQLKDMSTLQVLNYLELEENRASHEDIGPKKLDGNNAGTRNVGVADIKQLPFMFEGAIIKDVYRRMATHGRDMMNTAIIQEKDGKQQLLGYLPNESGKYHEAWSPALQYKRNRETLQRNQKKVFGHIGLKYRLSREDIMSIPLSQLQRDKAKELYENQDFVNIDQYIKEHGEEGLTQLRGQMAAANKLEIIHDKENNKQIVKNHGNMFHIEVTPEEYKRRKEAGLIYTGEGDEGILDVRETKKGNVLYTINDFESLHYSQKDMERKVLLEDTINALHLENVGNELTANKVENFADWFTTDAIMSLVNPLINEKGDSFNIENIDSSTMELFKAIDGYYDLVDEQSVNDITEKILNIPENQISAIMNAIYMFDEALYKNVIGQLAILYNEVESEAEKETITKDEIVDNITNFNNGLDLMYPPMHDFVDSLTNYEKEMFSNMGEDAYKNMIGLAFQKGYIREEEYNNLTYDQELEREFTEAIMGGSQQEDIISGQLGIEDYSVADEIDQEIAELYTETPIIDTRGLVNSVGTNTTGTRVARIKQALQTEIQENSVKDYEHILGYINNQDSLISGGPLGPQALNIANMLSHLPYYSPLPDNIVWKEETPHGDEEPSVLDFEDDEDLSFKEKSRWIYIQKAISKKPSAYSSREKDVSDHYMSEDDLWLFTTKYNDLIDYSLKSKLLVKGMEGNEISLAKQITPDMVNQAMKNLGFNGMTVTGYKGRNTLIGTADGSVDLIFQELANMLDTQQNKSFDLEKFLKMSPDELSNGEYLTQSFLTDPYLFLGQYGLEAEDIGVDDFYDEIKKDMLSESEGKDYQQILVDTFKDLEKGILINVRNKSESLDIDAIVQKALDDPSLSWDELGVQIGSKEFHEVRRRILSQPMNKSYWEVDAEKEKEGESHVVNLHQRLDEREKERKEDMENPNPRKPKITKQHEKESSIAEKLLLDGIKESFDEHYGVENPKSKKTTKQHEVGDFNPQYDFSPKNISDFNLSDLPYELNPISINNGDFERLLTQYKTEAKVNRLKQNISDHISPYADKIYDKYGSKDNEKLIGQMQNWSDKVSDTTVILKGFSDYLQQASDSFPPLITAVIALDSIIGGMGMIEGGIGKIQSFLNIGEHIKADSGLKIFEDTFLEKTITENDNLGKLIISASGAAGEAIQKLTTIFWEFLGPIALITAGIVAVKGALDWSYQSHEKYLKSLEEDQKEKRSKTRGLQTTNENAQEAARNNRAPRQQDRLNRNAQLAQTRLDNANMSRSYGAIEIARQKNDTLWGDYGIAAGLGKLQGNYESTAAEYDGTSGQIRRIKEATLANPFSSDAMNQVSSYYDANQLAFGVMDEYKDELGKLYDSETSAMLKYHSDDVRGSPEFQKALDDFVEATGITRDHAQQYLDYMQTEHEVDKATQSMQAQADQIAASTELKVQAIAFGGNPADVLGLNGIEAQQDSMIKAQADMIKMELSGQLWWKAVWSTITTPIKLILSPIFIIVDLLNAIWSLMTGNIGGAFESGGRAASRLNVFGEAATYWGAWADTEATDFNAIGQNATDSRNRANYGNVEQSASGGYHPTHYLDANAGNDRREYGGSGYYQSTPIGGSGYSDHRESQTHYINANRGSYHFLSNGNETGSQPTTQLSPLSSIGSMLSTIISILTTGLLVGGGIYGLTKFLKSDLSLGDIGGGILGTLKGDGPRVLGDIFGGIFKEGTILGKIKDKFSPITDLVKDSFGARKDQIKDFFGFDNVKDAGSGVLNKGSEVLGKIDDKVGFSENPIVQNWKTYFGSKLVTDEFSKKKRKGMNASDRDFLIEKYGLDIDLDEKDEKGRRKYRTADQRNKAVRQELDKQGKWDEAMGELYGRDYVDVKDAIGSRVQGLKEDYANPWKEYLGNQYKTRKQNMKDNINGYIGGLQEEAERYRAGDIREEDVSSQARLYAKGLDLKEQVFGKAENTDFNALLKNPKEFLSDPRNIEGMARDVYSANKDKIFESDYYKELMANAEAYRERPDFMENAPLSSKLVAKGLDWKDKYMQGDSIQDILKDPERTVDILQGTWQDLQGGALDDLNIGQEVKDKVSGFFDKIKEGAEEGIDDDDGEGGSGGIIQKAKEKLAGFFGFGKEDTSPITKEEIEEKEKSGDFKSVSDWKKEKLDEIETPSLSNRITNKMKNIFGSKEEEPISNIGKMANMDVEGRDALIKSGLSNGKIMGNTFVESTSGAADEDASILDIVEEGGDLLSSDNLSKGGKGLSKVGKTLSGKGGKLGKVGNLMSKVGGGASKAGAKGVGGVAKGGIGKLAKGGVGKGLGKVGGKIAGKVGGKVASKALAQVGSKVLGGALMATGIGAPLGLLLESPIGGFLMEGAMDLGGKALGAIGGAVSGVGNAIGGLLGFGKKTHYQQAGSGGPGLLKNIAPGGGMLGAMAGGGIAGLMGMGVGLLGSIFKNNKDHKNQSGGIGNIAQRILKNIVDGNKQKPANSSGGSITIQNININTADDPEAIKAMFLELLIELQEQVNPRLVSRTVGEPPANSTTDTSATETPTDENTNENNNNNNTNTENTNGTT